MKGRLIAFLVEQRAYEGMLLFLDLVNFSSFLFFVTAAVRCHASSDCAMTRQACHACRGRQHGGGNKLHMCTTTELGTYVLHTEKRLGKEVEVEMG